MGKEAETEMVSLDRNLALDAVRVTEAAARAAARLIGRGDEKAADQAAVDAMRSGLNALDIAGTVVIGEGERDEAPMLYIGEAVGTGKGPSLDVALDPLEGTTICATGGPNALAVLAMAEKGGFLAAPRHLHGQDRRGRRIAGRAGRSRRPSGHHAGQAREGQGLRCQRAHRPDSGPAPTRGADRQGARDQRPHPIDPGWRRRRCDRDHAAQPHRRYLHGHRRRARGRAGGSGASLYRRPDDGPPGLPQRRREEAARLPWVSPT